MMSIKTSKRIEMIVFYFEKKSGNKLPKRA